MNGSLVNTDTSGPWSYSVSGLANGTYTLTAKAFDQLNAETTSAPVTVTVGAQPKLHFVHVDHLNTPRLITNDLQQTVWRWDQQEPFGVNVPDENPLGLGAFEFPLRFPGQYADKETNLFYNYLRDYDPGLGRYVQSDPIGLKGDINTYAYVRSQPLMAVDVLGLQSQNFCQAAPPPAPSQCRVIAKLFCRPNICDNPQLCWPDKPERCVLILNCFPFIDSERHPGCTCAIGGVRG